MILVGFALALALLFFVMYWWSEGLIDTSEAIILETVFGGLLVGLFAAQTNRSLTQFMLASVPLLGAGVYVVHCRRIGSMRYYYQQRCEEYMRAIQADPHNIGAREFLADTLYNLGELDRAIDEMQAAVAIGANFECQNKLAKWCQERHLKTTLNPVCKWCGTENDRGRRKCSKCGADLPYDNVFTRWLMGGKTSRSRYYLLMIAVITVASVSFLLLPAPFAYLPTALCLCALVGWWLLASAR